MTREEFLKLRAEQNKVIWEMWQNGKSMRQISKVVGIEENGVFARIRQMQEAKHAADKGD